MHRWLFRRLDRAALIALARTDVVLTVLPLVVAMALPIALVAVAPINTLAQIGVPDSSQAIQSPTTSANVPARRSAGGFLGVYLGDINEERAKELKLSEARGAVVGSVEEGSPAAAAGLRENDVIVTFNEQRVYNPSQLYRFLTEQNPGNKVVLGVSRAGMLQSVPVTLGPRRAAQMDERSRLYAEADAMMASAEESAKRAEEAKQRGDEKEANRLLEESKAFRSNSEENRAGVDRELREGKIQLPPARRLNYDVTAARYQLGVRVTGLTEQLAKFFHTSGGVLVNEVVAGEAAERSGIKAGDCIAAVNGERVNAPSDLNRLVDRAGKEEKDAGEITLTVVRDRAEQTIKVRFGQR